MNVRRNLAIGCLSLVLVILAGGLLDRPAAQTKPEGEMRWALYVTLSPVWFDPGEVVGTRSLRSGFCTRCTTHS